MNFSKTLHKHRKIYKQLIIKYLFSYYNTLQTSRFKLAPVSQDIHTYTHTLAFNITTDANIENATLLLKNSPHSLIHFLIHIYLFFLLIFRSDQKNVYIGRWQLKDRLLSGFSLWKTYIQKFIRVNPVAAVLPAIQSRSNIYKFYMYNMMMIIRDKYGIYNLDFIYNVLVGEVRSKLFF